MARRYINKFCQFERGGWSCALCTCYNEYTAITDKKYQTSAAQYILPELRSDVVELECYPHDGLKFDDDDGDEDGDGAQAEAVHGVPMYVALVDVCGGEDYLELIRSALQAALEAMPAGALFGLITFSTRIGLYEVSGAVPTVRYVPILEDDGAPTPLDLEDALPLACLLTRVADAKDAIAAAIDALPAEPFDGPHGNVAEALEGGRGFGSALQVVLRYLGGAASMPQLAAERVGSDATASGSGRATANGVQGLSGMTYAGSRLLAFLAGPPNYGRGAVFRRHVEPEAQAAGPTAGAVMMDPMMADLNPYTFSMPAVAQSQSQVVQEEFLVPGPDGNPVKVVVDGDSREFYEEAAAAAASLAVCIDMYVASPAAVGLRCLEPLAVSSGGVVYLYPSLEESALPQDMYRRLSAPQALGGLLRVRTSPDFRTARAFGHLYPDDQYDNLFHVISCDPQDAFAFDFEFANSRGFEVIAGATPVLQVIFQYSVLLPTFRSWGPEGDALLDDSQPRFTLQRRMRVLTAPVPVASSPREVLDAASPDAVLAVLLHKIVALAGAEGAAEGHALLHDWLVQLATQYNMHVRGHNSATGAEPDVSFDAVETLQPVPRLVYGLLRSPVLTQAPGHHPDLHTALRLLWTALPPEELRRAVYPLLSSFTTPDVQAFPRHSLSEAALATSGAPIFLLDSFTQVIVYYAEGCPADVPYPPPQQSALRKAVNALRASRRLTPQLRMLRAGADDVSPFLECLIEEPDAGLVRAGATAGQGFLLFLESVREAVARNLQKSDT